MRQRKAPLIAGAVLFSLLLWLFVKLGYEYQSTVTVAVDVVDVPEGMGIRSLLPETVQVQVRGGGWLLTALAAGAPPVLRVRPDGSTRLVTAGTVDRLLDLPAGVVVLAMAPETLVVDLEEAATRRVPLALGDGMRFGEGYGQIGPAVFDPPAVEVTGAKSLVTAIDTLRVAPRTAEALKAPFDAAVPVRSPGGERLAFVPRTVRLLVDVQALAEKVLASVPVRALGEPPDRELILIPPRIDVTVRGGVGRLAGLEPGGVEAVVLFDDVMDDSSGFVEVRVTPPAGLEVVARRPERIEYVVRKKL